jgi:hypothetical protein
MMPVTVARKWAGKSGAELVASVQMDELEQKRKIVAPDGSLESADVQMRVSPSRTIRTATWQLSSSPSGIFDD